MISEKILREILTTSEYTDIFGALPVNVADAMMAIANAINRLAAVHEQTRQDTVKARHEIQQFHAQVEQFFNGPPPGPPRGRPQ